MMKAAITTKITLPSAAALKYQTPLLGDYAIATGAQCLGSCYNQNGERVPQGSTWVANFGEYQGDVGVHRYDGVESDYAGNRTVTIMPRIQNPAAMRFGLITLGKETVLTQNGNLVRYPLPHVGDRKAQELTAALAVWRKYYDPVWYKNKRKTALLYVGGYHSDAEAIAQGKIGTARDRHHYLASAPYLAQKNNCYYYKGKYYVYLAEAKQYDAKSVFGDGVDCVAGQGYWFESVPVRAAQNSDGSIQITDQLTTCQFEPQDQFTAGKSGFGYKKDLNTDEYAVGKFLNGDMLADLTASAGFDKFVREAEQIKKLTTLDLPLAHLNHRRRNGQQMLEKQ